MENYEGEKFLDKLYSNLYMSDVVQHTKENKDKRYEAIRKYLERLHRVHLNANTQTKKELLKSLYYDKYVIKEDVLIEKIKKENNFYNETYLKEEANKLRNNQKRSLSNWIDYLTDENSNYPLWAKYWAFQGMLKMGNYDEGIEGYQKRSKDTEAPFVDANPEIIAKANMKIKEAEKIDIYSLGVTLYCLFYGKHPYNLHEVPGKDYEKILQQIHKEKLEFPKERKISNLFKDFLEKTLEKDYRKRIGIREALDHPWIKASKAIFDEKENLGCLENFLIKLITDNIANFNELIK